MKQCSSILGTYASDVSGVCSALYELGGLIIMDDASGCNSTYNTHDEPRWYTKPSMIYVSALTEMQAVLGHDTYLIKEIEDAVNELHPRFVAIAGTPIPKMTGTDIKGLSRQVEKICGIPVMGFDTDGMHSYIDGASQALLEFAKRFCTNKLSFTKSNKPSVNILGVTPLDFSITGNIETLKLFIESNGYLINSVWATGSSFEQLITSPNADVNIVVSSCGLDLARYFEKTFGTPYIIGLPVGSFSSKLFSDSLNKAFLTKQSQKPIWHNNTNITSEHSQNCYVIGESIISSCIALTLYHDFNFQNVKVLSSCDFKSRTDGYTQQTLLNELGITIYEEDDYFNILKDSSIVIADPLYKFACLKKFNTSCKKEPIFISIPHEAYSGRIFRNDIDILIGNKLNEKIKTYLE